MKSLGIAGAAALALAVPTVTFAAGAGFAARPAAAPVFNAPHQGQSFNLQHQIHPQVAGQPPVFGNHGRQPFANYGYYGGPYSTLTSGTFDSTPPENVNGESAPPPFYYGVPYYSPPPRPCVRPLLIHIGAVHHHGKLPRVVYGTPPDACAG